MSTRVLLVDEHTVVREALRCALEKQADIVVVGEAADGHSALQLCSERTPAIVIAESNVAGVDGVELTRRLTAQGVKVVILSGSMRVRYLRRVLKAGAMAYLSKCCTLDDLLAALRAVLDGRKYLSSAATQVVLHDYTTQLNEDDADPLAQLSARERELVQLLAEGATAQAIAHRFGVNVRSVATYRYNVLQKLGLRTTADVIKFAIRENLTPLDAV
jgi:DNA-binding NarL/FixJ family response regulator